MERSADHAAQLDEDPPASDDAVALDEALRQLLRAFAAGIVEARDPFAAELHASEVLGHLATIVEAEGGAAPDHTDGPFDALFGSLVQYTAAQRTPEAQAVLRTLAGFADDDFRAWIDLAADENAAAGVPDPSWARTIGHPKVHACYRYGDFFGSQESITVVFGYGSRRHGLAVLIDHALGGGIKDAWGTSDTAALVSSLRRMAGKGADITLEEIDWAEARKALAAAAEAEPCPVEPDQVEDCAALAHLIAARVSLLPDDADTRRTARRKPAGSR